jgi:hypothetical protein
MSENVKGQLAGPGLHDRLCRIEERLAKLEEITQASREDSKGCDCDDCRAARGA